MTLPSQCIGSIITAATSSPTNAQTSNVFRKYSISPNGTWRNPGINGKKGLRKTPFAVPESEPKFLRQLQHFPYHCL